jgi:archaemetzincin
LNVIMHRIVFALMIALCMKAAAFAADALPAIAVQPLGNVPKDVIETVTRGLAQIYAVRIEVLPAKEMPASAYFRPRARHRAEKLLDWLETNTDAKYAKVIGLTTGDISTTKDDILDWGIFGLGQLGRRPCVVSTFRLGRKVPRAKMLERTERVASHEIGHTFGLEHCPEPGCIMRDAEGKVATVDSDSGHLCERCRARVPAAVTK